MATPARTSLAVTTVSGDDNAGAHQTERAHHEDVEPINNDGDRRQSRLGICFKHIDLLEAYAQAYHLYHVSQFDGFASSISFVSANLIDLLQAYHLYQPI